jgi:dihydropteroate synthase
MILRARERIIQFPRRPLVMGIVNINDDSLSGDGTLDIDRAIEHARAQWSSGADIIDVGGESARTNRREIAEELEIGRVLPFVQRFAECYAELGPIDSEQVFPPLLSINTWRPAVARTILAAGGDLLNDMSALATDENAVSAAKTGAALSIMHSVGQPKQNHTHVRYDNVVEAVIRFFASKIDRARRAGVPDEAIILDPGLDFAKPPSDSLRVMRELEALTRFGRPILLPVSRKRMIGEVLNLVEPKDRDAGTVACIVAGALRGASIFRVHNVQAASQALRVIWPVIGGV